MSILRWLPLTLEAVEKLLTIAERLRGRPRTTRELQDELRQTADKRKRELENGRSRGANR
jgi:hypothetical protein